jgi:hypothetical protein
MPRLHQLKKKYRATPSILLAALATYTVWVITYVNPSRFHRLVSILDGQKGQVPGGQLNHVPLALTEVRMDVADSHFLYLL